MNNKLIRASVLIYVSMLTAYVVAALLLTVYGIWADYPGKTGKHIAETFFLGFFVLYVPANAFLFCWDEIRDAFAANSKDSR